MYGCSDELNLIQEGASWQEVEQEMSSFIIEETKLTVRFGIPKPPKRVHKRPHDFSAWG